MSRFRIGDWVEVVKCDVETEIGLIFKVERVSSDECHATINGIKNTWSEHLLELAEMSDDLWSRMSTSEKFIYNSNALAALSENQPIEGFYGSRWMDSTAVNMNYPYRPKKVPTTRPDTVIKWKFFREEKPLANETCFIELNNIITIGRYSGMGSFYTDVGIVTCDWWSPRKSN